MCWEMGMGYVLTSFPYSNKAGQVAVTELLMAVNVLPTQSLSYKCFKPYKAWEMLGKGEFWGHNYQGSSLFSPLLPPRTTEVFNPIKRQQA